MKITDFDDTETLYIELRAGQIVETRDLDKNALLDVAASSSICTLPLEHASHRSDEGKSTLGSITAEGA